MIIKSKSRKQGSFRQLLQYMILGEERVPDSRIILHNIMGETLDDWVSEFQSNEKHRLRKRKNSVKLYHEILAWHPEDTDYLNLNTIEDLTREYIQHRNPNGLYVGAIHLSQDHYHVHLCISGVEYQSGKPLRISKEDFRGVKEKVQTLEQSRYPELYYSRVEHGKKLVRERKSQPRTKIKELIVEISRTSRSANQFLTKLKEKNCEIYFRRGKPTGILYQGKRHRFTTLGLSSEKMKYLEQYRSFGKQK